jgi:hypothetical protein
MAKNRVRYVEAPARRDVYFGMLAMINLAMVMGVIVLALECNEYDWDSQPKGGPTISLPTVTAAAPKPGAGGVATPDNNPMPPAPVPMQPMPAPAPGMGQANPEVPGLLLKPIPPVLAAAPEPAPAAPKAVPLSKPEQKPDEGPRPGFNPYIPQ